MNWTRDSSMELYTFKYENNLWSMLYMLKYYDIFFVPVSQNTYSI